MNSVRNSKPWQNGVTTANYVAELAQTSESLFSVGNNRVFSRAQDTTNESGGDFVSAAGGVVSTAAASNTLSRSCVNQEATYMAAPTGNYGTSGGVSGYNQMPLQNQSGYGGFYGSQVGPSYYDSYSSRMGVLNRYNRNYNSYGYSSFGQRNYGYSPHFGMGGQGTGYPMGDFDSGWFGKTADTLGKFSYMLDMNTSFMDQIFDMALNLAERIRLISTNLSWMPESGASLMKRSLDIIRRKLLLLTDYEEGDAEPEVAVDDGLNHLSKQEEEDFLSDFKPMQGGANSMAPEMRRTMSSSGSSSSLFSGSTYETSGPLRKPNGFVQSFYRVESVYMDHKSLANNKSFRERMKILPQHASKFKSARNRLRNSFIFLLLALLLVLWRLWMKARVSRFLPVCKKIPLQN